LSQAFSPRACLNAAIGANLRMAAHSYCELSHVFLAGALTKAGMLSAKR
jgi:hypothetical protein